MIVTPSPPKEMVLDDPLRFLRAIRFSARFDFEMFKELKFAAADSDVKSAFCDEISRDRRPSNSYVRCTPCACFCTKTCARMSGGSAIRNSGSISTPFCGSVFEGCVAELGDREETQHVTPQEAHPGMQCQSVLICAGPEPLSCCCPLSSIAFPCFLTGTFGHLSYTMEGCFYPLTDGVFPSDTLFLRVRESTGPC